MKSKEEFSPVLDSTNGLELPAVPAIELTESSRYRKLILSILALVAVHLVQVVAKKPVTWPVVAIDAVIVLGFVASNVLEKAFQTGALGKRADAVKRLLDGGGLGELKAIIRRSDNKE